MTAMEVADVYYALQCRVGNLITNCLYASSAEASRRRLNLYKNLVYNATWLKLKLHSRFAI